MGVWAFVFVLIVGSVSARSSKDLIPKEEIETEQKFVKELEQVIKHLDMVEKIESELDKDNISREARGLLKKLSFLAGMKVGGLIESSGTLAASNSLRIFDKVMNAALSLSYGSINEGEEIPEIGVRPVEDTQVDLNTKSSLSDTTTTTSSSPLKAIRQNFIKTHNNFVERVNHKFLKNGDSLRSN